MALVKSRSEVDSRREAILDAAAAIFLDEGFAATSMSSIAARLGGSKGTLYNYFKSKEELFAACVLRFCDLHRQAIFGVLVGGNLRSALTDFGCQFLSVTLSDLALRHFRVIVAEAERCPAMGQAFCEAGPNSGVARLAQFLTNEAKAGRLTLKDPLSAAHQFGALCQHRMLKARLCGMTAAPTAKEIAREVHSAVETFMAAFAPTISARPKRKGIAGGH